MFLYHLDNFTEEATTDANVFLTDEWTTEGYNTSTPELTYENTNLFTDEWSTEVYTHQSTDEWNTEGYTLPSTDEWSTEGYSLPSTDEWSTTTAPQSLLGWHRTVLFLERRTNPGEDVFFRGGIASSRISDPKGILGNGSSFLSSSV